MFSLANKSALITGAGSGIGAATAEMFSRAGARVFVTDRDETSGSATIERIVAVGGSAVFLQLDIADEAQCLHVAQTVLEMAGHLDVLVNNAGIGHVGTIATTTAADLDRLHAVNTRGTFNIT